MKPGQQSRKGRLSDDARDDARMGRFQILVGDAAWAQLPAAVRARFSVDLAPGEAAAYLGEVASTRMTAFGWCTAQVARLVGAPLPLNATKHSAAAVIVTKEASSNVQFWTRVYHRAGQLPQVIRSAKHFSGPTGLEEIVRAGLGMTLRVSVERRALVFRSERYFCLLGRWRLWIPNVLTPGRIQVVHREERAGRFSFALTVTHVLFGETIHQVAFFRDVS